ncbi:hypothetical protein ACWF95_39460 [Streptomyces vinaceus]
MNEKKKALIASCVAAVTLVTGLGSSASAVPGAGRGKGAAAAGYDVTSYDARVEYDPGKGTLSGDATLNVEVPAQRDSIDLRLQLPTGTVEVDGTAATKSAVKEILQVKPAGGLSPGRHTVHITYAGNPADSLAFPGNDNLAWAKTKDGGHYLALGTAGMLFPASTDSNDRADVSFQAVVPDGWTAVSNGLSSAPKEQDGHRVYRWSNESTKPSAMQFGVGDKWSESDGMLGGIPVHYVYGASQGAAGKKMREILPGTLAWEKRLFGKKYLHDSLTIAFMDFEDPTVPNVTGSNIISMSMEYASTPGAAPVPIPPDFLVHELSHTWLGENDSDDSYVGEAIPTYLQWAWLEKFRNEDLVAKYRQTVNRMDWHTVNVYSMSDKGMYALRRLVGDRAFYAALKEWMSTQEGNSPGWEDFRALVEKYSKKDLKAFFDNWFPSAEVVAEKTQNGESLKPSDEFLWPDWAKG